ncbi:MAG TPA: hypothetical protein VFG31_06630 [Conexibacter sp.]|nr:hypothetical protein [Conexibacter sp.]
MSEPLARLYDLALRTLDEHERRADPLRSRLGPTLAAAALGVTLLSDPLLGGAHPTTTIGKLALDVAAGGMAFIVMAAFRLVSARHHPIGGFDTRKLAAEFERSGVLDVEQRFYKAMLAQLNDRIEDHADTLADLARSFTAMQWGILVMLCGLALAALVG